MFYISHLKMKNFKSFKALNIELPPSFICFAGPNGAGKSNILDAIRFVLGETSLKSLRARRVNDLIHHGAKAAEVMITFDGDGKYEIRRAIREDGKVIYRLNGKRATKGAILEALKKFDLDDSGRNIIAQGEVQRIVNMSGKERRTIIDAVAGISDFEEKKKEALKDLEVVDTRIKEANIVLGERKAFLEELEKERELALKYIEKRDLLNNSKGTLLKLELDRLQKECSQFGDVEKKLNKSKEEAEKEYAELDRKISEVDKRRMELSKELQGKQQTGDMIRRIEELKASLNLRQQTIRDKEEEIKKLEEEQKNLKTKITDEKKEIDEIERAVEELRKKLKILEEEAVNEKITQDEEALETLRNEISKAEKNLNKKREELAALRFEINSKREVLFSKKEDLKSFSIEEKEEGKKQDFEKRALELVEEKKTIDDEIEELFKRTKEINKKVAEIDKELLELKEKAAIYKVRSSPQLMNPALRFIADLKKNGEDGIYGTVADLIEFEQKYIHAIEAAGGPRLMYVVVDNSFTAVEIIEKLKKVGVGRATFIPLDVIKVPEEVSAGGFSSILKKVKYKEEVRKAIEYVFGDTLLIEGSGDARKVGIGNYRMVTLSGEIFERSGVISGGKVQSSILSGNEAKKIEDAITKLKDDKNACVEELYSIREKESLLRAKRSQVEIEIKTLEMESKALIEKEKERAALLEKRRNLENEIKKLEVAIEDNERLFEQLKSEIGKETEELEKFRTRFAEAEAKLRKESDEQNKIKIDIASQLSSTKATIEGKLNEIKIRNKNIAGAEQRIIAIMKEIDRIREEMRETKAKYAKENEELMLEEKKIAETGKKIEKLFDEIKQHENEIQELSKGREKKRMEIDRILRELNQLNVKKATAETRLEDIKIEYERYKDAQFLEGVPKAKLMENINECEKALAEAGNVNIAAIEMYEKKKTEIEEITKKIEQLSEERKAILKMIDKIEERKKEAFFDAFYAVNDNFKKMFQHVNIGEGYLILDNPNEPFESGLFIKIKKGNHEFSIDSLSGGELTLVTLMFIFALQFFKPSPFYILDEVDAALDKPNSKNLAQLIKSMSEKSQFILASHNDMVVSLANAVFGVTRTDRVSKVVGLRLKEMTAAA